MQKRIDVIMAGEVSAAQIAAYSRSALDRPLPYAAELWVAAARDTALLLGAFQRSAGARPEGWPHAILRRGSGGPEVALGPATVHVALSLPYPAALAACDEKRIVNRMVRPLLRALTKTGSLAHFFGRDWISVAHRPAAWVGFAHDATSQRTLFEAFIAVRMPFACSPRASFLGKEPSTLEAVRARPVDIGRLMEAVADSYASAYDVARVDVGANLGALEAGEPVHADDPPWTATVDEAIGLVGAGVDGRGIFRVGGDLLASRDALARFEALVAEAPPGELARITDETLGAAGVALDGIRSLESLRDVVARARAQA